MTQEQSNQNNNKVLQDYIDGHPDSTKTSDPVNTNYVAKDSEIIIRRINKLATLGSNLSDYVKELPETAQNTDGMAVGFGLLLTQAVYYGGYGNFRIAILHYKGNVLHVKIDMSFTGRGHEFIRDEIIEHIDFPVECSGYGIYYSKTFENVVVDYNEKQDFPLRINPSKNNYTKQEIEFYKTLSDPTTLLMWGRKCGYANAPPVGRVEMDNLISSKKYELVEDILHSANVVGRVYALQALEEWDATKEYVLTQRTKDLIAGIKDLEVKFEICDGGCMVIKMSYKELAGRQSPGKSTEAIFPESNKPPYFYAIQGGDWVKINENWSIRFVEVLSDARCPYGVTCETCGKATVKIQLMQPDVDYTAAYFETLEVFGLNRYPMPNGEIKPTMLLPLTIDRIHAISKKQIGCKITLVDLRPYPAGKFVEDVKKIKYAGLFHVVWAHDKNPIHNDLFKFYTKTK